MKRRLNRLKSSSGQVMSAGLIALMVLMVMVPVLVNYVNREATWSVKEKRTTTAFHLADAAVERGRWKILQNPVANWNATSTGTIVGYNFDQAYSDVTGGYYAIRISSDSTNASNRIIEGVGKDSSSNEVRKVHMVLQDQSLGNFATRANQTVGVGAATNVEWGDVVAGISINTGGRLHPRFYSAAHITPQDGGVTTPQTDNIQWWSYYAVPPSPGIDFSFYSSSALNSGADPCGGSYYTTGSRTFQGCTDTSNNTYYITGDLTFASGAGGNFIQGSVVCLGNITFQGNGGSNNPSGVYNATVPPTAWKDYGNDWGTYTGTYDPAPPAPLTYAAAVSSNYLAPSSLTYPLSGVLVHGFLYTGGSQGLNGGGNGRIHGVLYSNVNTIITSSNFTIYYDAQVNAAIRTSGLVLVQVGWYEVQAAWPPGI